jgi:hypothetical protein
MNQVENATLLPDIPLRRVFPSPNTLPPALIAGKDQSPVWVLLPKAVLCDAFVDAFAEQAGMVGPGYARGKSAHAFVSSIATSF